MKVLIFSKNRACQLNLLLKSLYKNAPQFSDITVIYTWSDEEFKLGYNKLIKLYPDVKFVVENGFRNTTLQVIEKSDELICPMVDDDIVYRECKLQSQEILECLNNIQNSVFSLRLGTNITVSDNFTNEPVIQPVFTQIRHENRNLCLAFHKMLGHSPFGYPISLDGHCFKRDWLLSRCQEIKFVTPNFLEGDLQRFNDEFEIMLCPEKSCVTSIPANRVQEEFTNRTIGEITPEELNQKWLDGEEISLDAIIAESINCTHSNIRYTFSI